MPLAYQHVCDAKMWDVEVVFQCLRVAVLTLSAWLITVVAVLTRFRYFIAHIRLLRKQKQRL